MFRIDATNAWWNRASQSLDACPSPHELAYVCRYDTADLLTSIQASQCYTTLPAIRLSSITITDEMGRCPARNSDASVADTEAQTIRITSGRAPFSPPLATDFTCVRLFAVKRVLGYRCQHAASCVRGP
jgi:hypothetical protein